MKRKTSVALALRRAAAGFGTACALGTDSAGADAPEPVDGIWIGRAAIARLPASGDAWNGLVAEAAATPTPPNLADQYDRGHQAILAKALVHARTGDARLRDEVRAALAAAPGTEIGGRTLSLARQLFSYVVAADLVRLDPDEETRFRTWLGQVVDEELDRRTLRTTHEERPNNWGTHAGASRLAVALYLGRDAEVRRCADVFRGWLGERDVYSGFEFGDLSWQADPSQPVAINPSGAARDGHSIDGVLPDDQRRSGGFQWPPPRENYVYEALQGAVTQAVLLERAGYDPWSWGDRALLRAFSWLQDVAGYPARGDDVWLLPIIDRAYGTHFWDGRAARAGKSVGWTDWTHAPPARPGRATR